MMREFSNEYLNLLKGEYSGINLTRITTEEDFYNKQIIDSILPIEKSKYFKDELEAKKILVDVGFGGGFPILPLAKLFPQFKFYGFDARAKKAEVVSKIALSLNLKNIKLNHARLEDIFFDKPVVITFKAVGKVSEFLPKIKTNSNISVVFYKGPNFYELEEIDSVEKDWELVEEISYGATGTDGRMLLCFKNKNVLRGTINPKLIKFSQLL